MPGKTDVYKLDDGIVDAFYAGTSADAYKLLGCHSSDESGKWRFVLWAPNARAVGLVGDFNDWEETACPMGRYRGLWVVDGVSAKKGDNYKYFIHGEDGCAHMKADPYAYYAEIPPDTASKVWDTGDYRWRDWEFLQAREKKNVLKEPVSIYELHTGSWRRKGENTFLTYRELADELAAYVKEMGFTHVELMPISEHPFGGSWGYQVTGFYAVTSRYGVPQDFMYFVDTMHLNGIGVIVDWVPAHFPKDAHGLAKFDGSWLYEHENPLRREHPQWGTHIFNYNRPEVRSFLLSSASLLTDVYHVDGIRVDAVSSVIYLDYGRSGDFVKNKDGGNIDYEAIDFMKAMNTELLAGRPGMMTIAEESTVFPLVTRPPYDGGLGFTFKWNLGFMHDTLEYMGIDPYFRAGAHDKMTFSMSYAFSENFILAYSHDEVVHGKHSLIEKMYGSYEEKFASLRTLYSFMYAHPGKKLLFMGDEFAQFIEWDYEKPLDWQLLEYDSHAGLKLFVRDLLWLYRSRPALYGDDFSWEGFCWLNVDDSSNSVFAFERRFGEKRVVCVFNFLPLEAKGYKVALPAGGRLKLLLSSDEEKYGGGGKTVPHKNIDSADDEVNGMKYSAEMDIPPLSALYYDYTVLPAPRKRR
ncbi:MAG: 1,4-alpha-glucan branching protein GlgB [Clostridiales Family XIII bacterium]|jgi:1,4-alpha-glucan branching enzyme|nr:1,4-alpha-glucan branching protein GlgB [Clostridiales Family XIII bacterium]